MTASQFLFPIVPLTQSLALYYIGVYSIKRITNLWAIKLIYYQKYQFLSESKHTVYSEKYKMFRK